MSIGTYDLFTDKELEIYLNLVDKMNKIEKTEGEEKQKLVSEKKELRKQLTKEIENHNGIPRILNTQNVIKAGENCKGINWQNIKTTRKISEFLSEQTRCMGLTHLDITFDKIIVNWKSFDILKQIILYGFYVPLLQKDGTIALKHYRFYTASAGQLRTDRVQFISDEAYEKIKDQMMCGLSWESINKLGGINIGKFLAYLALPTSATDPWDFNIKKCIVVEDFEAPVTDVMDYITPEYKIERGLRTVKINHIDGSGMCLPGTLPGCKNAMVRAPWIKGLLTEFDYIEFCKVHNVEPEIKDVWGKKHNLIEEDIKIIFTASQHKLWKYYQNWDDYVNCFIRCNCHMCLTNYEEDYIKDSEMNYQFLQSLDMTDDEITAFTRRTHNTIENMTCNKEAMLQTLRADEESDNFYNQALRIYEDLLSDGYAKESLKAIKKRKTLDAMSGAIKCKNKRLFAIPDMYAACEYWFLGIKEPNGLLKNGEVFSRLHLTYEEGDILRSPHLYREHAVRKFCKSQEAIKWFKTNGIYTSCKDLISRILQFDVDGDQLNIVIDYIIVPCAKRNMEGIVPLFYDAVKAQPETISWEDLYNGVKRAHDFSGIGEISNMLTKLWNKPNPDLQAAAMICKMNNFVID